MIAKLADILSNREKYLCSTVILLTLIAVVFEISGLTLLYPLIDSLLSQNKYSVEILNNIVFYKNFNLNESLIFFSIILILIFTIKSIFFVIFAKVQFTIAMNIQNRISVRIFEKYLFSSLNEIKMKNTSTFINNTITETHNFVHGFLLSFFVFSSEIILLLSLLIFLLFVSIKVFLVFFVFSIFLLGIYIFFTRGKIKNHGIQRNFIEEKRINIIQNAFTSIKEIILYKKQNFFLDIFKKLNKDYFYSSKQVLIYEALPRYFIELIVVVLLCSSIISILFINNSFNVSLLSKLAIFFAAGLRLIMCLSKILNAYPKLKFYNSSLEQINNVLKDSAKENTHLSNKKNLEKNSFNSLELINLNFSYDQKREILNNINLSITHGDIIGLCGDNGSGKTTLLDLIMCLRSPSNTQSIFFNGRELNKEDEILNYQSTIGFVPQEINLFHGSIDENITFSQTKNSSENIKLQNIQNLDLFKFISKMPDSFSSNVGEMGLKLSGGQRQRILIARTIYRQAEFLIFDEPTSAIDQSGLENIIKVINFLSKDKTILISTHNKKLLDLCNKVYKIENKTIKVIK